MTIRLLSNYRPKSTPGGIIPTELDFDLSHWSLLPTGAAEREGQQTRMVSTHTPELLAIV
jgi:hypothetical protein